MRGRYIIAHSVRKLDLVSSWLEVIYWLLFIVIKSFLKTLFKHDFLSLKFVRNLLETI